MWLSRKKQSAPSAPTVTINEFVNDVGAARLRQALLARDWPTARDLLTGAANSDVLSFYLEIAADTPGVQDWIERPIRDEPGSVWPLLVRGAHGVFWAWEARGSGGSSSVSQEAWKVWFERLKMAENCLDEVLEIDPGCAEAWHYLIILGRARQLPTAERWRRFEGLLAADPHHLFGHEQMLDGLMAKWSGSDEEMFDFARSRAAANPGTLIPVLVAQAHLAYAERHFADHSHHFHLDEVGEEIATAANASIWHPDCRKTLLSPSAWNWFALTLTMSAYFDGANMLFDTIGDNWVRARPWNDTEEFVRMRTFARANRD